MPGPELIGPIALVTYGDGANSYEPPTVMLLYAPCANVKSAPSLPALSVMNKPAFVALSMMMLSDVPAAGSPS